MDFQRFQLTIQFQIGTYFVLKMSNKEKYFYSERNSESSLMLVRRLCGRCLDDVSIVNISQ